MEWNWSIKVLHYKDDRVIYEKDLITSPEALALRELFSPKATFEGKTYETCGDSLTSADQHIVIMYMKEVDDKWKIT